MKKTRLEPRKLTLERQTIRKLTRDDLKKVGGGNLPMSPWCVPPDDPWPGDDPVW